VKQAIIIVVLTGARAFFANCNFVECRPAEGLAASEPVGTSVPVTEDHRQAARSAKVANNGSRTGTSC